MLASKGHPEFFFKKKNNLIHSCNTCISALSKSHSGNSCQSCAVSQLSPNLTSYTRYGRARLLRRELVPGEEHEPQQWSSEDDLAVLAAAAAAAAATAIPEALAFKFRRRRRPLYPLLRFVLSLPFPLFYKFDATLLNTLTQTHGPLDISFVPGQPVAAFDTADDSGNETGKAKPAFKIPAKYDIYTGRREKKKKQKQYHHQDGRLEYIQQGHYSARRPPPAAR